jgi:hypothetical protein
MESTISVNPLAGLYILGSTMFALSSQHTAHFIASLASRCSWNGKETILKRQTLQFRVFPCSGASDARVHVGLHVQCC